MSSIWAVGIPPDADPKVVYVGRNNGTVEKYSVKTDALLLALKEAEGSITAFAFPSSDEVIVASTDSKINTLNFASEVETGTSRLVRSYQGFTAAPRCLLLNGDTLYCGSQENNVHVIAVASGEMNRWKGHADWVSCLTLFEGTLYSGSYDGTVRAWDTQSGVTLTVFQGLQNQVKGVLCTATSLFAIARDGVVKVWTTAQPEGSEGSAAPPPTNGAGEDEDGAKNAAASSHQPRKCLPHATIEVPSSPHAWVAAGSTVYFGCADHVTRAISVKELQKSITDYQARVKQTVTAAKAAIDESAKKKLLNAQRRNINAIRRKHKELLQAAHDSAVAERAAKKAAQRLDAAPAEDDEEEHAPEPHDGGNDDNDDVDAKVPLTEAQAEQLAAFKAEQQALHQQAIAAIEAERSERTHALQPVINQQFHQGSQTFLGSSYGRELYHGKTAAAAVAVDGQTLFIPDGDVLVRCDARLSITTI